MEHDQNPPVQAEAVETAQDPTRICRACGSVVLGAISAESIDLRPDEVGPLARGRIREYAPIRSSFSPDSEGRRHLGDDPSGVVSYRIDTRPPGMYMLLDEVIALTTDKPASESSITVSGSKSQRK